MSGTFVKCPTCGRELEWSNASPFRPFCSERCKLIDFGAWLSEGRSVAGEPVPAEQESGEDPSPQPPPAERERE